MREGYKVGYLASYSKQELEFAKKNGFESWELIDWPSKFEGTYEENLDTLKKIKGETNDYGIELSCLGYYPNHLEGDIEENKRKVNWLIDLTADLGLSCFGTFTGRVREKSVDGNIPEFKKFWEKPAQKAEDQNVKIAFENCPMFQTFPFRGTSIAFTPYAWDKMFEAIPSHSLGLEYDPSHLICLLIDPYKIILDYGDKIYHVHAKDAEVRWNIVRKNGIFFPRAVAHRTPGMGQADWAKIISNLVQVGYKGNLDIEGRHDPVFRRDLENEGLVFSLNFLKSFVPKVKT